ncbi:MAG: tRNA (adenosine(37)-N6)-threonylcarbamoyltransferase complex dimerization subunit type 1 TsaB [Burkholderiaceae bacterium]
MTLRLLAFDTSTEQMSLGVQVDGRCLALDLPGGARASAGLIPAILRLLAEAGIGLRDLDAIGYGRGPGAFTGLRTACAVAQGLAFGVDRPVLALDTLAVVAESARRGLAVEGVADPELDIWVAMDARMHEVYAARYTGGPGGWSARVAPMLIGPAALNERWAAEPPSIVAGNALAAMVDALIPGTAQRCDAALPQARALLAIADAAWHAGAAVDAAQALPLYLRDKVAQTTAEREAVRRARDRVAS